MKLSQTLAVERSERRRVYSEVTRLHHESQKQGPLSGIARNYTPREDGGEQLPPETGLIQQKLPDLLDQIAKLQTTLFDVTATKDWANTKAAANVVVDGQVLLERVPVTYLLFLEKNLSDMRTIIAKLPVLEPTEEWEYDSNTATYRTAPRKTFRTKKVLRNHVKSAATDKFPAQVETYTEDVVIGEWDTVKFSGALPQEQKDELLSRIEALQRAVKIAREEANSIQVEDIKVGRDIFQFIFED